jgi:Lsr2
VVDSDADRLLETLGFNQQVPRYFIDAFPYANNSKSKEGMMAQRVELILEDDIDGGAADETVRFAYDRSEYEIDLSTQNAEALRSSLRNYIEHARKARTGPRQPRGSRNQRVDTSVVRAWAREHGKEINDRGRIPAAVMKEYDPAQAS